MRRLPASTAAAAAMRSLSANITRAAVARVGPPSSVAALAPTVATSRHHTARCIIMASNSTAGEQAGRQITDPQDIEALVRAAHTVAVLGCKTEAQASQPAFYVPAYLQAAGVTVLPVLTFYPDVTTVLGVPVVRRVADVQQPIDILDVFRKPSDLMPHLEDIVAAPNRPKCVWLQSGIRHPEFENALLQAGVDVVADECLMVVHQRAVSHGSSHL